jgi:two-component system, NtrC family, sensor histidine kinase GlrK
MRLTIFSRVMIAQSTLIALILVVSLYALAKLHLVSELSTDALTVDATCLNEEKRLLKAFLAEMRNAEKYLLIRDQAFYEGYTKNKDDFTDALSRITGLISMDREKELVTEIALFHNLYNEELNQIISGDGASEQTKVRLSEGMVERANELIRLRDQATSAKTALVRDHASSAAEVLFWLTLFGMGGASLSAYFHARGISQPLKRLAQGMRHVGRGEFTRSLQINGPKELQDLALAFNMMAEELEHLDRLKADFTAHVSHELRTPLTAVREGTALLLEEIPGPLTEGQREILDVVRNHSQRLFHSITSILDLSKMEAEMMDYDFTACDLTALIEKSVTAVDLIARKREIELRSSVDDEIPMMMIDERRIQQVLDNLLSNAIKFSPEKGEIFVDAFLSENHGGGRTVEVRVSDEGPGIAREELQNIFKHFYQSTNNRAKGQQGTGLGLAIARHIVEAHRGRIWAESETGGGSTFHFTLPVDSGVVDRPNGPESNVT